MKFLYKSFALLFLLTIHLPMQGSSKTDHILFYRGTFTDTDLLHIIFKQELDYRDSDIYVLGINRELRGKLGSFSFEKEGHFGIHRGVMKHVELNALLIARYRLPGIPFSFGLGEGLSLASRNPDLENKRRNFLNLYEENEYSNKMLNYLMFEIELKPPGRFSAAKPFFRIHHRSGIYGIYCPPTCGSNFISYGVKVNF
ncbi:MAG: hypothetical protein OEZ34_08535 [Spirochaetia bacterium]|nr:hypothetical protein [Spirochaetia bacterium]